MLKQLFKNLKQGWDESRVDKKLGAVVDRRHTDIAAGIADADADVFFPTQPISSEHDTFSDERSGDPM